MTSSGGRGADAAGPIGSKRVAAGLVGVVLVKSVLIATLLATGTAPLAGPAPASQTAETEQDQPVETGNATDDDSETAEDSDQETTLLETASPDRTCRGTCFAE